MKPKGMSVPEYLRPMIEEHIAKAGQHLQGVFPAEKQDGPTFCYTIGLALQNLPELIVVAPLDMVIMSEILNRLCTKQRKLERPFKDGEKVDIDFSTPVLIHQPLDVDIVHHKWTIQAGQFLHHQNYNVLQVLIPDKKGRFPGEKGCEFKWEGVMLP